jgi:hypothetical protein
VRLPLIFPLALFTVLAPCVLAASPVAGPTIPAAFRGVWAASLAGCRRLDDSALTLTATTLTFAESHGRVVGVRQPKPDELEVQIKLKGEGESWVETYRYRLSADGKILNDISTPGQTLPRHRCP